MKSINRSPNNPKTPLLRLIPPLTSRNSASHFRLFSTMTDLEKSPDSNYSAFCKDLVKEIRRISPAFKLTETDGPILGKVLSTFKQCVDDYLQKYSLQIIRNQREKSQLNSDISDDDSTSSAKSTMKHLLKFEKILKLKEQKIKEKSAKIESELANCKALAKSLEQEKKNWNDSKLFEESRILSDKKKNSEEKQKIEDIKLELKSLKNDLKEKEITLSKHYQDIENNLKTEKSKLTVVQTEFSIKNIELEKLRWEYSKKLSDLETRENLLQLKQDYFSKEKLEFEREKSKPTKVHKFEQSPILVLDSPTSMSNEMISSPFSAKSENINLELIYLELNERIEKVNKEIEAKEQSLSIRETKLNQANELLNERILQFGIIHQCLTESKSYMNDYNSHIISDIDTNSNILVELIQSVRSQKTELEELVERVEKDVSLLTKYRSGLITNKDLNELKKQETETLESES